MTTLRTPALAGAFALALLSVAGAASAQAAMDHSKMSMPAP